MVLVWRVTDILPNIPLLYINYCIVEKFGSKNRRIYPFWAFGELIDQPKALIWMVLVWWIMDNSLNSPNYPHYMVHTVGAMVFHACTRVMKWLHSNRSFSSSTEGSASLNFCPSHSAILNLALILRFLNWFLWFLLIN